jgi:hypothetical protein
MITVHTGHLALSRSRRGPTRNPLSRICIIRILSATQLIAAASTLDQRLNRLVVKSGGTTRFVRVVDIDWIEAASVYVNLHVAGQELLYRAALNDLAARPDSIHFILKNGSRSMLPMLTIADRWTRTRADLARRVRASAGLIGPNSRRDWARCCKSP